MMAANRFVVFIIFQPFIAFIITGALADNSIVNLTYHATSPTSLFAPQNPLVSTASNSRNDQPYTNNSSISSQQYSSPVVSTKFSKLSSYLGATNSITPSSHQFTTPPPVSMKMTLQVSQTVSNTQKTMSDQHRYRSSDDIYSISVLLFISGICAIILLAFFIKVLLDSKKRNKSYKYMT